jgi:two-component system, NarL family, response regulator LiaR
MADTIRILIVDDHAVVRKGLAAIIEAETDLELAGEAVDGLEAATKVLLLHPDVILMDLVMPREDGVSAITSIRSELPEARILVLTSYAEDDKVFPAIKAGAQGYMLKDSSPDELIHAIREVNRGEIFLHPTIARKLIVELKDKKKKKEDQIPGQALTERELEVIGLIALGLPNQEIADRLIVSEATVRFHVGNILSKLHLANRTQVVLYALREGLAQLD